ncbi:MAG: response regulator [bacterium]|nr:response regulator [bacterium]
MADDLMADDTANAAAKTRKRILLVEDEPSVRRVLIRALADYDVIEAANAEVALDLMAGAAAELVITDIALAHMDGCALAARLHDRWTEVPIIAISGHFGDRDLEEFGFDTFLEKPIDVKSLRGAVAALLCND